MVKLWHLGGVGFVLRLAFFWISNGKWQQIISKRVEVATPVNSWDSILSGYSLSQLGISPYQTHG